MLRSQSMDRNVVFLLNMRREVRVIVERHKNKALLIIVTFETFVVLKVVIRVSKVWLNNFPLRSLENAFEKPQAQIKGLYCWLEWVDSEHLAKDFIKEIIVC